MHADMERGFEGSSTALSSKSLIANEGRITDHYVNFGVLCWIESEEISVVDCRIHTALRESGSSGTDRLWIKLTAYDFLSTQLRCTCEEAPVTA
jgi:hypothetical protein